MPVTKPSRHPDYRCKLPHYLPNDAPYFVTTHLAGSLSAPEVTRLKAMRGTVEENRFFVSYDESLDQLHDGIDYLRQPTILAIVRDKLMKLEGEGSISIHAFCIMPNHIHLVIDVTSEIPLFDIMKLLKGATARECNKVIGQTRKHFWQWESYDHVVRHGSLERVIRYVLMNPVKAGLVDHWWEWPGTYLSAQYDRELFKSPN